MHPTGQDPQYTAVNKSKTNTFRGTLDYILFSSGYPLPDGDGAQKDGRSTDPRGREGMRGLVAQQVLGLPDCEARVEALVGDKEKASGGGGGGAEWVGAERGLPSGMYPSDHLLLAARFLLETC